MIGIRKLLSLPATACALLGLALLPPLRMEAQQSYTEEMIGKAWQGRQERVRSARFTWTGTQTDPKGTISNLWKIGDPGISKDPNFKEVIPPRDTTFPYSGSLVFAGNQLRYSYTSARWSLKTGSYEPFSYLGVFDGTVCKVLNRYGEKADKPWPQGMVRGEKQHLNATEALLQPILLTFRGRTPGMHAPNLDSLRLTGRKATINNRSCLELQRRVAVSDVESQLWVDPARDFVFVRYLRLDKRILRQQIDVTYEMGPGNVWVPKEWAIISNERNGTLRRSYRVRLTDCEINPSIDPASFDLEFPPGTAVFDAKQDIHYIVRPDGSGKRIIPRSDIGATYEQLLKTQPGQAFNPPQPPERSSNWPAIVGVILVAGCLLLVLYQRVRRKGGRANEGVKN
ncbi:MAG: hypothetical protein L0Z62_18875 [Gemmataceae bacterium]|nr:hypothetical protein [Gemmataceae bacterium]